MPYVLEKKYHPDIYRHFVSRRDKHGLPLATTRAVWQAEEYATLPEAKRAVQRMQKAGTGIPPNIKIVEVV